MSTFKERQTVFAELAQRSDTRISLVDAALDEITRLRAEIDGLRTGDTCARQCEGTAYRIEARHWPETIAENEVMP